jgi:hypothetical protein
MSSTTAHAHILVSVSDCIVSLQADLVICTLQTLKENVHHIPLAYYY